MQKAMLASLICSSLLFSGCSPQQTPAPATPTVEKPMKDNIPSVHPIWPTLDIAIKSSKEIEDRVESILSTMTLEQKIGQMIQPEIRDVTTEDMRKYGFGSFLNGGGAYPNDNKQSTAQDWIDLAEAMYQASIDSSIDGSAIPAIWGTDAVHGHNNVIGATLFPHNIGLGAAHDPDLIKRIAEVTAKEVLVTGIDWIFAPTVATVRNDRWGRTYEGYSENPEVVRDYSAAIVKGLQGTGEKFMSDDRVISTVKHFLGDGGTVDGVDQGNNVDSEEDLFRIHAQGYVGGLTAGSQSVMATFNSWNGEKIHGSKYLLTDVLKNTMGFDGFVVGDWNGHGQIEGCTNEDCAHAINAGLDIFMAPTPIWKPLFYNTLEQAKKGIIPIQRIDDAVRRILRVKVRTGLFERPSPANRPFSGKSELLGSPEHRAVAREAVRKSLVLLKNKSNILPLSPQQHILVSGDGAHNIGKQSGGWTITWQGTNNTNEDFPNGTSIFGGIASQVERAGGSVELSENGTYSKRPDVAIVVFGEDPYAEGIGDIPHLEYSPNDKTDLALLRSFKEQGIPTVALFISGRPLWINPELNASDAFVAIWLPGSEGEGIADVILRDENEQIQYDFHGKLSYSWPREPDQIVNEGDENYNPLFAYNFGLTYQDVDTLSDDLPETWKNAAIASSLGFYNRSVLSPWKLYLFSGDDTKQISASSMEIGALSYRTQDRLVQEDAFSIALDGSSNAGIRFMGNPFFKDVSAQINDSSILDILVNITQHPSEAVFLSMDCGDNTACNKRINITETLTQLPLNQWHRLHFDAKCFSQSGVNFKQITHGLSLSSEGKLGVILSDMAFVSPEDVITADVGIYCE